MALFYLFFFITIQVSYGSYSPWRKELWCPDNIEEKTTERHDHDCACEAKPIWELQFANVSYEPLILEILDVQMKKSLVYNITAYLHDSTYFNFIFTDGKLHTFPENLCDFKTVTIDVTNNLFSEIGNLSCLTNLDTLVMKGNLIEHVSNESFTGMDKLRYLDLSFNLIRTMDLNIVAGGNILNFNFESNNLGDIDITNILPVNKSICRVSYANNKKPIEISNDRGLQLGDDWPLSCTNLNFSHVPSINPYPLTTVSENIHSKELYLYAPCGVHSYEGSGFNCSCELADYFSLEFEDLKRFFSVLFKEYYCEIPEKLHKMKIRDVYNSSSLRDQMTCNIRDGCHSKCECISQPSQGRLLVDCSNQSLEDFPDVVPNSKHDIELIMKHNKIKNLNAKPYFDRVKILDLSENPLKNIENNVGVLENAREIYIYNHSLKTLPKTIWDMNPYVFHFGTNGIPCDCENIWIGEWRIIKNTSRPLYCSNYQNDYVSIEDTIDRLNCDDTKSHWIFLLLLCFLMLWFPVFYNWFRFDFLILKRKLKTSKIGTELWQTDMYISFNEEDSEVRYFILKIMYPFLVENGITTYIPYKDDPYGINREDAAILGMKQSKYIAIVQSADMYNSDVVKSAFIRRKEYDLAWSHYILRQQTEKIFIIQFDSSDFDKFNYRKSRALNRFGMGFFICDRKNSWKSFLIQTVKEHLSNKPYRTRVVKPRTDKRTHTTTNTEPLCQSEILHLTEMHENKSQHKTYLLDDIRLENHTDGDWTVPPVKEFCV